jgi:hypothetical protein
MMRKFLELRKNHPIYKFNYNWKMDMYNEKVELNCRVKYQAENKNDKHLHKAVIQEIFSCEEEECYRAVQYEEKYNGKVEFIKTVIIKSRDNIIALDGQPMDGRDVCAWKGDIVEATTGEFEIHGVVRHCKIDNDGYVRSYLIKNFEDGEEYQIIHSNVISISLPPKKETPTQRLAREEALARENSEYFQPGERVLSHYNLKSKTHNLVKSINMQKGTIKKYIKEFNVYLIEFDDNRVGTCVVSADFIAHEINNFSDSEAFNSSVETADGSDSDSDSMIDLTQNCGESQDIVLKQFGTILNEI